MLKKGTVCELRAGELTRDQGHIVATMCHYPRGLSKSLIDEYCKALAPSAKLLKDFHAQRDKLGGNHNAAFTTVEYEKRFELPPEAIAELERLAEMSKHSDVYFVCQCEQDQRCHRELLLIAARKWFGAQTELRKFSYPIFERRLPDNPGTLLPA